jgi:hypothetical protein
MAFGADDSSRRRSGFSSNAPEVFAKGASSILVSRSLVLPVSPLPK